MPYKDRETRLAYYARWRTQHRTEIRSAAKVWNALYRARHPEKIKALYRAYAVVSREKHRLYYLANRDAIRQRHRANFAALYSTHAGRRRHRERMRAVTARREAQKRGTSIGPIDYDAIYARDGARCQICGKKVEREEASFDHIVPLSREGPHEEANIQTSHLACNIWRSNRRPAQIRLVL